MFLRWMVRKDKKGVDLGIWKSIDQKNYHAHWMYIQGI